MKQCGCCKAILPKSDFFKHNSRKDGLQAYCKPCKKLKDIQYNNEKRLARNEYHKEYRKKNRVQFLTSLKKYRENNKALRLAAQSKRRASKINRTPAWLTKEQHEEMKEFYKMAKELETVFGWKQCVDHIIPLQGQTVSGLHVPSNLQILSAKANMEKGNRY